MQGLPMDTLSAVMLKKGRGRHSLLRPWNERLIVLSPTQHAISYYIPSSNQDQAPVEGLKKGELSLIDCHVEVVPFAESGKPFTFELTTADGQLTLSASSAYQRDEWMRRIESIVASRKRVSSTTRHANGICSLPRAQKKSLDRKSLVVDFPDASPSSLTLSSTTRRSSDAWTISDLSEESCFADMPLSNEFSFVPSLQLSERRAQEQQLLSELAAETNALHDEENAAVVTAMKKLEKYRQLAAHEASLVREWQYWGIKNDLTEAACDSLLSPRSPRIISPRVSPRLDSPRAC